ncbi:uncharacterized protein LOC131944892 [Physella acuta]|uniref:uncharacterized protein LOC131944892 n=1 Tax=Physella acuta TaxID=109671 RepID=UPI0027DCBE23|nr:uncharacterized protein LOC131944892 [Physella acuta]
MMSTSDLARVFLLGYLFTQGTPVGGQTCSAYTYTTQSDDALIKIAAILGFQGEKCDRKYDSTAIQQMIALKWAESLLRGDPSKNVSSFIPGVSIGIDIYDDCKNPTLAAEHAGMLSSYIKGVEGCSYGNFTLNKPIIAGIIGTTISQTTTVVSQVLNYTDTPVVGISATLGELSNKSVYKNFVRTVPSDLKQAKVIIELAKTFKWSYVLGIHSTDNYGVQGMAEVQRLAQEEQLCVSTVVSFEPDSKTEMENFVRNTLINVFTKGNDVIGVVYFGRNNLLLSLLDYIKLRRSYWGNVFNALKKVYWIGTDGVDGTPELIRYLDEYQTKILLIGPQEVVLTSYQTYFRKLLEDPPDWMAGPWRSMVQYLMQNSLNCGNYNFSKESLSGCVFDTSLSPYLTATLDSVYLLANTFKAIHKETCFGAPGICLAMKESLNSIILRTGGLREMNYTNIDANYIPAELITRALVKAGGDFEVFNQPQFSIRANIGSMFTKIGEFKDNKISITSTYSTILNPSRCSSKCQECFDLYDRDYIFSNGTYVILGLYSLHWRSDKDDFGCDVYRGKSASFIAQKSFITAVTRLKMETGLNFGYLVIDDCYNPLRALRMLMKIFSGDMRIEDRVTGAVLNASSIRAVVGSQSSAVTMATLSLLNSLGIPMVSYSASNPDLTSPINYPYFSRTVSSDTVQANALVSILQALKVTRVGVIVIKNIYGQSLSNEFQQAAQGVGICVDPPFEMTEKTTSSDLGQTFVRYRSEEIQVIVVMLVDEQVSTMLKAVREEDSFVFLGSETWGPNPYLIANELGERARGSIILAASAPELVNYQLTDYLKTMSPFSETGNGWLQEFWEDHFQCNLPGGFKNNYPSDCSATSYFSDSDLNVLVNSSLVIHSWVAAKSVGLAIKTLAASTFKPDILTNETRNIQIKNGNSVLRPFDSTGNGNAGFQIYNIRYDNNIANYMKVGEYNPKTGLNLPMDGLVFYTVPGQPVKTVISSCVGRRDCKICGSSPPETSTQSSSDAPPNVGADSQSSRDAAIGLGVFSAILFLIIVGLVVVAVLIWLGKIPLKDRKYTKPKRANNDKTEPPRSPPTRGRRSDDGSNSTDGPNLPPRSTSRRNLDPTESDSKNKQPRDGSIPALNYQPSVHDDAPCMYTVVTTLPLGQRMQSPGATSICSSNPSTVSHDYQPTPDASFYLPNRNSGSDGLSEPLPVKAHVDRDIYLAKLNAAQAPHLENNTPGTRQVLSTQPPATQPHPTKQPPTQQSPTQPLLTYNQSNVFYHPEHGWVALVKTNPQTSYDPDDPINGEAYITPIENALYNTQPLPHADISPGIRLTDSPLGKSSSSISLSSNSGSGGSLPKRPIQVNNTHAQEHESNTPQQNLNINDINFQFQEKQPAPGSNVPVATQPNNFTSNTEEAPKPHRFYTGPTPLDPLSAGNVPALKHIMPVRLDTITEQDSLGYHSSLNYAPGNEGSKPELSVGQNVELQETSVI